MPTQSYLMAQPNVELMECLKGRPELRSGPYWVRGSSFGAPDEGVFVWCLPTFDYRPDHGDAAWYVPREGVEDALRFEVCEGVCAYPDEEVLFEPEDLRERFQCFTVPPRGLVQTCRALSRALNTTLIWYGWVDRGDTLYEDVAWVFAPSNTIQIAPGVTFEKQGGGEEFTAYDGFGSGTYRGWRLWGNAREESSYHDHPAVGRMALHLLGGRCGFSFLERGYWTFTPRFLVRLTVRERMEWMRVLCSAQEPNQAIWGDLLFALLAWPDPMTFGVGFEYAKAHVSAWSGEVRASLCTLPLPPVCVPSDRDVGRWMRSVCAE